jgi:hypothetical protein
VELLHSDSIPEYGAAAERAGRIDGNYGHAATLPPESPCELVAQRALSRSRSASNAHGHRSPGVREEFAEKGQRCRFPVLDGRRGSGDSSRIPGAYLRAKMIERLFHL